MKNKRLIAVLGMHRSGSSAITKGLEVLGVDLGSHLMEADANNTKGYFEDVDFNQLNTAILRANGHDWFSLARMDKYDFSSDKFTPLRRRALGLLKNKLAKSDLLGIKDPRLCRLLPFWKGVFDELGLEVSYVIILRDPEHIAASLFARDSIPRVKSLYLWLEHMIPVFQETRGCNRCVVNYDQLVSQPVTVIESLAGELDLDKQLDRQALQAYGTEFIDAGLKHHRGKPGPDAGFTSELTGQLTTLLDNVSKRTISIDSPEFNRELDSINRAYRDRTDILAYIDTLDSIIIDRSKRLAEQAQRLENLSTVYNEAKVALDSGKEAIARCKLQIDGLKAETGEKEKALAALKVSLEERHSKIASLEQTLSELNAQTRESERRMKTLERRYESTVSDAEDLALQLDKIHASFSWRSLAVLRKPWNFLRQLFKPG